ncbi:related to SWD2-subunit of the COMPASS complex [Sporisorium reilianum f. sp. reilianum]|uniref:Related to SWD2-subunit of the COMPASS complex n=1 Tax=Sporisorium reilianum f. sp. reilianum TaxID=72559 RepID=A0A2N8UDP8_9BASI|nr:related to SWD2-subunit of the COMPASS complex [Sporisorium reilianum f. sp. reilianum]
MAAASTSASASATAAGPSTSSDNRKLAITPQLISAFKPAKVFTQHVAKGTAITSASFDNHGFQCITSGEDGNMHIYDAKYGVHKQKIPSLKYGVHLARFTHDAESVMFASTKENNAIRYMDVQHGKFIRYFEGHDRKVVTLQRSPHDDTFLSGSVDEAVRLWDVRTPKSMGHMHLHGHPVVAYDPTGKVFAVAINERSAVLLYDVRKFDQMPFLVVQLDDSAALSRVSMPPRIPIITSLTFTPDSQYLLLGTSGDVHYVIDTFAKGGPVVARLVGHEGLERASGTSIGMVAEAGISGQEVCWTADGKWVLSGSADGSVVSWYVDLDEASHNEFRNLKPRHKQTGHDGASRVVVFNPRYAQFMSAGAEVAFWLPDLPEDV